MKVYAVTGEVHGSIIEAQNSQKEIEIFMKHYDDEKVIHVKDISNSNLDNL